MSHLEISLNHHPVLQAIPALQVKQKGGTVEQIVIADMAFDVLKNAWAKFEVGELRKWLFVSPLSNSLELHSFQPN